MSLRCQSSVTLNGAVPKISDRRSTGLLSCWSRRRRKHRSLPGRRRTKYIHTPCVRMCEVDCSLLFVMWLQCIRRKRLSWILDGERGIPEIFFVRWFVVRLLLLYVGVFWIERIAGIHFLTKKNPPLLHDSSSDVAERTTPPSHQL